MDIANPFFSDLARGVGEVACRGRLLGPASEQRARPGPRASCALELFDQQLRVRGVILAPISNARDREPSPAAGHACRARRPLRGLPRRLHRVRRRLRRRPARGCSTCSNGVTDGSRSVGGTADIAQVRERRDGASRAVLCSAAQTATLLTLSIRAARHRGRASRRARHRGHARRRASDRGVRLERPGRDRPAPGSGHRKVAVPDEISIVGYDDIDFAAAAAVPLSSVSQPRVELGRRAAELLFDEVEALDNDLPHEHQHVQFVPELVIRRSTSAKRRRRLSG